MIHFEVYSRTYKPNAYRKTKVTRWYWRMVAANGRIIADGSQGYTRKSSLLKSLEIVKCHAYHAPIRFLFNARNVCK